MVIIDYESLKEADFREGPKMGFSEGTLVKRIEGVDDSIFLIARSIGKGYELRRAKLASGPDVTEEIFRDTEYNLNMVIDETIKYMEDSQKDFMFIPW